MSDLALSESGDLLLDRGRVQLVHDAAAVAQLWTARLTMFRGEWFLDRSIGIDYQNDVLVKNARPTVLRTIFAQASRETPGVADVTKLRFAVDPRTRVLTVEAEVVLGTGEDVALGLSESIGG